MENLDVMEMIEESGELDAVIEAEYAEHLKEEE